MKTVLNYIKVAIFWLFNPSKRPFRDMNGKVIDDWRRRKHIKETKKYLDEHKLKGSSPRCYKIEAKGKVVLKKQERKL